MRTALAASGVALWLLSVPACLTLDDSTGSAGTAGKAGSAGGAGGAIAGNTGGAGGAVNAGGSNAGGAVNTGGVAAAVDAAGAGGVAGADSASGSGGAVGAGGAAGSGSGPIPFARMKDEVKSALCEQVYNCCSADERAANPILGTDRASCSRTLTPGYSALLADIEQSVVEGRVVYHGDKLATCLREIRTAPCDRVTAPAGNVPITSLCKEVFEARIDQGGACTDWWDCKGGWCEGDDGGLQDKCVARKPLGETCDRNSECLSNFCELTTVSCSMPRPGSGSLCRLGM